MPVCCFSLILPVMQLYIHIYSRPSVISLTVSVDVKHHVYLIYIYIYNYFIIPCGKFGSPYLGKVEQPQEQRHPFLALSMCTIFVSKLWYIYSCQCWGRASSLICFWHLRTLSKNRTNEQMGSCAQVHCVPLRTGAARAP